MTTKNYETPVLMEFEMHSVQSFLQSSAGVSMNYGGKNQAGSDLNVVSPWDQDL